MNNIYTKSYLFIAGLVMVLVGSYISLSTPEYFEVMNPLSNRPSTNMQSDLRGMGGMLLVLGLYALISIFRNAWRYPALTLATVVFAIFIAFRTLSFILDGLPEMTIIIAYLIEGVLAVCGVLLLKKMR